MRGIAVQYRIQFPIEPTSSFTQITFPRLYMFVMIVGVYTIHRVQVYNLFYLQICVFYSDIRLGGSI